MLYFLIKVQYLLCSDFSDLIDGKGFNANKVLDGSNCKLTKARTQKSTKKRKEKKRKTNLV
jgi:hypothetical protein